MQYLAWRVLCGLTSQDFLLIGHTKFAPDWCFGLLKQKLRKSLVECLDDLVRMFNESAHTNHAELVGKEDGTVNVPQYDWSSYFQPYFRSTEFLHYITWPFPQQHQAKLW